MVAAATAPIAGYLRAFEAFYKGNVPFDTWVKSVNAAESATTHVFLGYRPSNINTLIAANGPYCMLRWENFSMTNQGGESSFYATVDIVADILFSIDWTKSQDYIEQTNYLDKINQSYAAIGLSLTTGFSGHILSLNANDPIAHDPNDRSLMTSEITATVAFGHSNAPT